MNNTSGAIRQNKNFYSSLQHLSRPARRSFRQGLASTGWESRKPIQEVLMNKLFPVIVGVLLPFFFASCTTTHVQWDAVQMR
jgi:hypothetical protein